MNIDELERKHKAFMRYDGNDVVSLLIHAGELQTELLAEVKRLQAYKEFADGIHEWSHGATFIHFLAEQVYHIRNTGELDEDALNHGCQQYYNGPNASSQVSEKEYKDLFAEVKHLRSKVRQLIQSDLQLLNKHGDCYYCGHDMMEDIPSCGVKHTEKNPTVDEIFEKEMKR